MLFQDRLPFALLFGLAVLAVLAVPVMAAPTNQAALRPVAASAEKIATNAKPAVSTETALEKRIKVLEAEVVKLWNFAAWLRQQIPGESMIARIADQRAALLVNKYIGGKSDDPTRLPVVSADGGIGLSHIVVGADRPQELLAADGVRIVIAVRGPKKNGNAFVAVYALPLTDSVLRPAFLIHADGTVPCIDGVAQAHFVWKGHFADGKKAPAGLYRVFVRTIVSDAAGARIGSAMRYWGATDAAGQTASNIRIQ